jgi:hypothetical protein
MSIDMTGNTRPACTAIILRGNLGRKNRGAVSGLPAMKNIKVLSFGSVCYQLSLPEMIN